MERAASRAPGILALALLALISSAACNSATVAAPQDIQFSSLSEAQRLRVMIELAQTGRHEEAAKLLAAYPLTGPLAPNRTLFIEGLVARGRGDLKGAASEFREALAADPSLTMVRAELAQTLYALGEDDSAKHHLELLMSEAPDQDAAYNIKSFIDRIDSNRPYRINAYISLAPTTNLNGGSSTKTIYYQGIPLTPTQPKSGTGLALGVNAGYTKEISKDYVAVLAAGANARLYRQREKNRKTGETRNYNQATFSETAEIRRILERGYFGWGLVSSQSLGDFGLFRDFETWTVYGGHPDLSLWTVGPRFSTEYRFGPKASVLSTSTFEFKNFDGDNSAYDGYTASENLTFTYAFRQDFVGFLFGGIERNHTTTEHLSDWTPMIGLGAYKELPWGITANADARFRFSRTDGDDWPQGSALMTRKDDRFDGTITLTKRDWNIWGYAPAIEYNYSNTSSNLDIFDSDAHTVDFRLTKDF